MGKGRNWKRCLAELFYCNPGLNKRALCIRNSLCEINEILIQSSAGKAPGIRKDAGERDDH